MIKLHYNFYFRMVFMLKFVIGESRSGKTQYCIKKAAEYEKSIIIVPEQVSSREERVLLSKLGVFGLGSVEVLSFGQMARRALSLSDNAALRHIDKAGKVMILQKIITEGSEFSLLKGNEEEKAVCLMEIIGEFKRYNITAEDVDNILKGIDEKALSMKMEEISAAYKKFEENIKDKFINDDDNLVRFALSGYGREKYKGYNVFIDSFSSFTQSEIMCIEMFLSCAKSVTVTFCMDFKKREEIQFSSCYRTYLKLLKLAKELEIQAETPVLLERKAAAKEDLEYLKNNFFTPGAAPFENEAENIEFFMGKDMLSEIEFVAGKIRNVVMYGDVLYKDIAVLCTEEEKYCEYIKTIFSKYEIKIFPDIKTNLANHPVAAFIKGALDVISKGGTYGNIFRCVKYGFFDISDKECDILENFALESGARGTVWNDAEKWEEFVTKFYKEHHENEEEKACFIIESGKKIIEPLALLRKEMSESMLVSQKCRALYNFITGQNLPQKLLDYVRYFESMGDTYTAIEYKSVYDKIIDVLDEACSAIGDDKISNKKFADILSAGISQFEIGKIPALLDGVQCGRFESVKETAAKIVFVLGANEGVFPVSINRTGFLNDFDRQRLMEKNLLLGNDAAGKAVEGEYLLYRLFTSAEKLYICHSASSIEGTALREAWSLTKIKELMPKAIRSDDMIEKDPFMLLSAPYAAFENLVMNMAKGEMLSGEYSEAYRWFKNNPPWDRRLEKAEKMLFAKNKTVPLSGEVLKKIYGDELITAVTRLEKFSACPFSYYMRYVLSAKERKVFKFEAKDAGVFLHSIAEVFSERLESRGKSWADVTEEYVKDEVREILISEGGFKSIVRISGKRGERMFLRLCRVAEFAIMAVAEHIKRGKFEPMGYELKFSENGKIKPLLINMPDGRKIKLTGAIDRLDMLEKPNGKYFRIIDYKTGNRDFDLGEVYHGITLQLAVYMCAAKEATGASPAGMLYFKFKNPDINEDPFLNDETIKAEKMKKISLTGLVISDEEVLSDMDVTEKFDFLPVKKKKDGTFSGSLASAENFEDLRKYVIKTVTELGKEIFSGKTDILPYKFKDSEPCTYCEFKDACNFDGALGCSHRSIMTPQKDEIWQSIKDAL